tara:strand:- start:746 stop:1138 length:393 start_codon:yes stop_codon:yes gene_type:complete
MSYITTTKIEDAIFSGYLEDKDIKEGTNGERRCALRGQITVVWNDNGEFEDLVWMDLSFIFSKTGYTFYPQLIDEDQIENYDVLRFKAGSSSAVDTLLWEYFEKLIHRVSHGLQLKEFVEKYCDNFKTIS